MHVGPNQLDATNSARENGADVTEQIDMLSRYLLNAATPKSASPPSAEFHAGRPLPNRLGHFTVSEVIGSGGMGVVFRAQQAKPQRTVALKVIRAGLLTPRAVRRFEYESELLARLQHPNIAAIYESGVFDAGEGSQPYFAMEFIEGQPLTRFADARALDIRQRLNLLAEVCDGVQHAHQRGVIHRDLKPANVLVDADGRPHVLDFGVAVATDVDLTITHASNPFAHIAGTLLYMSPEQLTASDGRAIEIDHRVDVYALGVVGYELLTGRLPFTFSSGSVIEAAMTIREKNPPTAGSFNSELRGDVETILCKALERDPANRYESVADLSADIRRFLADQPIRAQPPSAMYLLRKFARRNRSLVGGLAVAGFILVLGVAATAWQAIRAADSERLATRRFDDVRGLARWMIFDLGEQLQTMPRATAIRAELVREASAYLERLAQGADDSSTLNIEIADSYVALASLMGRGDRQSLGDVSVALAAYSNAIELYRKVLNHEGTDVAVLVKLAAAHEGVLATQKIAYNVQGVLEQHEHLAALLDPYLMADPQHSALREVACRHLGELALSIEHFDAGDAALIAPAMSARLESLAKLPEFQASTPERIGRKQQILMTAARAQGLLFRTDEAITNLDHAERLHEQLRTSLAGDDWGQQLADIHAYRGHALRAGKRWRAAASSFETAIEWLNRSNHDPLRRHLVKMHVGFLRSCQAASYKEAAEFELALQSAKVSVDSYELSYQLDQTNDTFCQLLAESLELYAEVALAWSENVAPPWPPGVVTALSQAQTHLQHAQALAHESAQSRSNFWVELAARLSEAQQKVAAAIHE